jgi:hypothetical protein
MGPGCLIPMPSRRWQKRNKGLPGFVWVAFNCFLSRHMSRFFFCTPVHSSAQGMIADTDNKPFRASQRFPSPVGTGSAVSAELCRSIGLFLAHHACARTCSWDAGVLERQSMSLSTNPIEVNSPLRGVGLLSSAVPPEPGSSERKTRIAMLHRSLLREQDKADTPRPF